MIAITQRTTKKHKGSQRSSGISMNDEPHFLDSAPTADCPSTPLGLPTLSAEASAEAGCRLNNLPCLEGPDYYFHDHIDFQGHAV